MTQTLTTETVNALNDKACAALDRLSREMVACARRNYLDSSFVEIRSVVAELLDALCEVANREAKPVADEIYAELYRLRIENKGPNGFETWRDAAVFERTRRADAERKLNGEEMTYLEAMSLLTTDDAKNLSAVEAFRRGASYNRKINAHALRNSMRYQYLRDKDAFGAENEPGLAGWDELIELGGNEFDAAIDARMTHSDIAYTAPPAPAVPTFEEWLLTQKNKPLGWVRDSMKESYDACRAAMLAQPVSQGYKLADDIRRMDWLVSHHVTVRKPLRYGSEAMFTAQTVTDEEDDYHATKLREQIDAAMLAAAPEGGK